MKQFLTKLVYFEISMGVKQNPVGVISSLRLPAVVIAMNSPKNAYMLYSSILFDLIQRESFCWVRDFGWRKELSIFATACKTELHVPTHDYIQKCPNYKMCWDQNVWHPPLQPKPMGQNGRLTLQSQNIFYFGHFCIRHRRDGIKHKRRPSKWASD